MSTPTQTLESQRSTFKRGLQVAINDLETACHALPYKFRDVPFSEKRKCIQLLSETLRSVETIRDNLKREHLAVDSDDSTTVRIVFKTPVCFYNPRPPPTCAQLQVALEAVERIKIEFPAPVPVKVFQEEIYLPTTSTSVASFASFRTAEDAAKVVQMGVITVKTDSGSLDIEFGAAPCCKVRKGWITIRDTIKQLDHVQAVLGEFHARETNDPYPFRVEISDISVVDATPAFLEALRDAQERFVRGDTSGVHILSKTPVKDLDRVKEKVEELNKERIMLINRLRQFQTQGYLFTFNMEI